MSNSNNVADWLPDTFAETHEYQWFLKHFPYERFVVVSWQGCTMDDSRLEMFAQKLVPGQTIDNIARWTDEQLKAELAVEAEIGNGEAVKTGKTTVKNEQQEKMAGSGEPLSSAPQPSAAPAADLPSLPYFKSVITGPRLFRLFKEMYSGEGPGAIKLTDEQIKRKMQGLLIGPDGNSTALIVTLTKEAPQGKDLTKVLEAVKEIGRECGVQPRIAADNRSAIVRIFSNAVKTVKEMIYGRNPEMNGVILGGPPVDNVAITHEGEQTLQRLAGICGLIGLTLAWLCFRDFRLTFFVFWTAIISAGVALASVSLTGGTCDAILLSMPALIYVLAMSGAIHLINYYHDAIREEGLDLAPERAVRHAWSPCFFANLTTAMGLISLYTSHLIPIAKFGLYSALGVMLQLLLLFYYLPTLLHFYPSHKIAAESTLNIKNNAPMQRIWRFWGGLMIRFAVPVVLLCVSVMFFFGYEMTQIKTSVKMMRFFSGDSEIIHHYTWLEEHLGPLVPMEVVVRFDNERCQTMNTLERLRLITEIDNELRSQLADDIGGVMSAETMTPPLPKAKAGQRKGTSQIVREKAINFALDKGRNELRDYIAVEGNRSLRASDLLYQETLAQLGITSADAERLCSVGIDDTKKLVNSPADREVGNISPEEFQEYKDKAGKWEREHGTDLWRISLRVWSLKKDIDYSQFIQDVKNVVAPIVAKADKAILETAAAEPHTKQKEAEQDDKPVISAVYTGMVPVVYKTQHELLGGLRDSFITSFVMITITISFILRSPAAGLLAMIPNLWPVFMVFGFMGNFGILVDVGTMMTASVALGISTDDTIHFLTWFRHGIDQKMNRKDATLYAYSRCATSMMQTTLIAGLGLSAFALSTFTPTQMFGIMMLAILTMASIGDLVFLAAMLNTPLGKVFEPKRKG
ncbi:MAG: MMPL family transporter [Planctomycetaceae bacterium]|nr:MMPL family transporter [Planctomycetaceae bacterium]